jgi:hypothetical protein
MERILLLEGTGFPEKFRKVEVIPPIGLSKQDYLEQQVLESINRYNPKLNLTKVEYANLNTQFPQVQASKFTGLIVEDIEILDTQQARFSKLGYFIWNNSNQYFARRIVMYVFLTNPKEESRNILVAQSIFPALIDYMSDFIASPSYTLANHPIYFINIINKRITAASVLKPLAGIIAAKINYIEVFPTTIDLKTVPTDVESFVRKYEIDCKGYSTTFVSDYYEVDFSSKRLKLKTTNLVTGDYLERKGPNLQFKGSSEKFYWMGVLPIFLIACQDGYDIDYSEIEDFYNSNVGNFSASNEKFQRFSVLLKFMKKLTFN